MTVSEPKVVEVSPTSFTVLGRTIHVKPLDTLTDGQRLGFVKIFRRAMHEGLDGAATMKLDQAISKLLEPVDNDWLDYQVMEDRLKWQEVLLELMACLRGSDVEEVKPAPVKKAVARKATKRAVAKPKPRKAAKGA